MRFAKAVAAASICLATAEGLKFQMYGGFEQPLENLKDSLSKRATTISTNFKFAAPQFSYYVDLLVGSTHDFIRLRLSSDPFTWIPGPLPSRNFCANSDNDVQCIQSNFSGTFNPAGSSTFRNLSATLNLTSSDPRYYALGYYGEDTVQIGQTEIVKVPIGIATSYTRTPQLGMGLGGSGSTQKTLLQTMFDENVIDVIAYGLYLNDYDTNSSELTIGAIDTAKYDGGLLTFESAGTTTVRLNNLQYDSKNGGDPETLDRNWNANVEFSTGLLYFPNSPLNAIVRDVDAYLDANYGGYLTDCKYRWSNKTIIFNFEGMTINVPASQWIVPAYATTGVQAKLRNSETPACIALVDSMDNYSIAARAGYSAVFGMPFVRATYIVHDFTNQQTSFAQAKLNTTDSKLTALGTDGVAPFASVAPTTSGPGPSSTGTSGPSPSGESSSSSNTGPIVGGVVGGVAAVGIAIGAFFLIRRRGRTKPTPEPEQPPPPPMDQTQDPLGYNGQGGYVYSGGGQGGYGDQYGGAGNLPGKGYAPAPMPGYVSEMADTPVDPSRMPSSAYPSPPAGIAELPSPKLPNMPVELPGHQ
ncbi:hypothetical protein DRE_01134 [Drechslerella stenobrocha 248]|uniref:Peptidase A1 domain-containing protein n=1 Tax=Drechslerella stenobrocha 248 TaxID=1043628 RepID=W7HWK1_9PEZI|nr:hypothetical protein DRE_01134 [Drechslerella stenobrocha 248]